MNLGQLLLILSVASAVTASAPDDEHPMCTNETVVHPPNYRILMDSYNYFNLLFPLNKAVWHQVDNDNGPGTSVSLVCMYYIIM